MQELRNNQIEKYINELHSNIERNAISKSQAETQLLLLRQIVIAYKLEIESLLLEIGVHDYE